MLIAVTIIAAALSIGMIFGGMTFLKKQATASVGSSKAKVLGKIEEITAKLDEFLKFGGNFASQGQLDSVSKLLDEGRSDLSSQKASLKEIETKLDSAQKTVEEKESVQQELKSAREEDENRLKELLGRYEEVSSESIALEQRLAASLKNLDVILDEIDLTQDQKAVFEELQSAMTNSGSRLRDLLTEYETVNERLNVLQTQHSELEEEYTKLVEQQLGE